MYYNGTQAGVYYGGQVAGPVMKELMSNILPYLGVEPEYSETELQLDEVKKIAVGDYVSLKVSEAKNMLMNEKFEAVVVGEGETVVDQFPKSGSELNVNSKVILYTN
ncbi:MAG: PASTA domain-containing protein [Firmicutes bacterium]|nr:PASTA domain-containing protein [Bacillota bacterium]